MTLSIIISVIVTLLGGYFLEGTIGGALLFGITGLIAGFTAKFQPAGAERIYWIFVAAVFAMVVLAIIGTDFNRFVYILPLVFVGAYFIARLVLKITGQKPKPQ